ncbi:MAG: Asp-tRNA(Asn)/Glu-tRNA(Gln) amidotransferase subunit GatB [Chloroflexi bacterium]|nr:Asp-tRNA(Asn)/Glu-tRNA(Gln) amidotransferase subunit GatB [Chloroflexota bacterium]
MEYEIIIGLEVHAQLLTRSKMFCTCSADYASTPPNTHVCPVCLGMPGVLPRINRQAVEYTVMTALALNCTIPPQTKFDRKNYPYPDLVKGYQISQYDAPVSINGWLDLDGGKRIGIERVHLEEDTAKLIHRTSPLGEGFSLVDVNRSGVPLMEVVSRPDMRSPEEARGYLMKLRTILQYLGVSTGNMEEGSFRCDANVSLRPRGSPTLLPKAEIKNMNSFRAVYLALEYEAKRQKQLLEQGQQPVQETRGWVDEKGITVLQRSKEYAHDYRYFPEPDLPPLVFSPQWIEEIRRKLPELPEARRERFMAQYGLSPYDAGLLTASRAMADYFEEGVGINPSLAKRLANLLLGEMSRHLKDRGLRIQESPVKPRRLVELAELWTQGAVTNTAAYEILTDMFLTLREPTRLMQEKGLAQISEEISLVGMVREVLAANPQAVADYKKGKAQAIAFLLGQVMRQTGGRANPTVVRQLLEKVLATGV